MSRMKMGEEREPKFSFLRADLYHSVRMGDGAPPPRVRIGASYLCGHLRSQRDYTMTDSTEGSGWMSDTYKGICCGDCGKIIRTKRVY